MVYTTYAGWIDQGDEPDHDEPEMRTRCSCGAFLPRAPQEYVRSIPILEVHLIPGRSGTEYDDYEEVVVGEEMGDSEFSWTCQRCGRSFSGDEMFR